MGTGLLIAGAFAAVAAVLVARFLPAREAGAAEAEATPELPPHAEPVRAA